MGSGGAGRGSVLAWDANDSENSGTLPDCGLNKLRVAGLGAGGVGEVKDGISSRAGAKEGGGWKGAGTGVANKLAAAGLASGAGAKAKPGCCGVGAWPRSWALLNPVSPGALAASGPVEEEAKGSKGLALPARGALG